jgi:predicted nucleotidyltransferase
VTKLEIPRTALAEWAINKPTIKAVYVFGSYARGEAGPESDLDLCFEFFDADDALVELIERAASWKAELSLLTGLVVKDLYLSTDCAAQGYRVQVFGRT